MRSMQPTALLDCRLSKFCELRRKENEFVLFIENFRLFAWMSSRRAEEKF